MADLLQTPFVRQTYAGIDNPIFVDDIQAANESIMSMAMVLAGFHPDEFAILAGLEWDGTVNYSAGYFILGGVIYYIAGGCKTGQYLTGSQINILSEGFNDGNPRNIYLGFVGNAWNNNVGNASPEFLNSMDIYRASGRRLMNAVNAIQTIVANLKGAAFLDVGSSAGTVMAGDDPRAPYTAPQLDARYAQRANVIEKGTAVDYTPAGPLDPVNRKYVDTTGMRILASGSFNPGPLPGGIFDGSVSFGTNIGTTNYDVIITLQSVNSNVDIDNFHAPLWYNPQAIQVSIHLHQASGGSHNVIVHWKIVSNN